MKKKRKKRATFHSSPDTEKMQWLLVLWWSRWSVPDGLHVGPDLPFPLQPRVIKSDLRCLDGGASWCIDFVSRINSNNNTTKKKNSVWNRRWVWLHVKTLSDKTLRVMWHTATCRPYACTAGSRRDSCWYWNVRQVTATVAPPNSARGALQEVNWTPKVKPGIEQNRMPLSLYKYNEF